MKRKLVEFFLVIVMFSFLVEAVYSQDADEEKSKSKSEIYRVIGAGPSLKDAEIDAYQNAIIEFFKNYLSPSDIKKNSSKLLKEFFSLNKIRSYIKSAKIISREDGSEKVKIVVDVTINKEKILESLEKLDINPTNPKSKEISKEED